MKKTAIAARTMNPFFDKIERLSRSQRIAIYLGTFIVLIGAFTYFIFLPKTTKIKELDSRLQDLSNQLAVAKKNSQELGAYRARFQEAETNFKIAMGQLPETKEIPSLLENVSQSGQEVGLEFLLFQPTAEVRKDFYAEIPVSIALTGHYHNVALFFDRVAKLSRIVNIHDIKMEPQKDSDKLKTSCTAVTYRFIEEQPPQDGKKTKATKKKT